MENTQNVDSQHDTAETETMDTTETIDYGGDFEDPTAPEKPSESRTFSETENPSISNENTETADSQQDAEDGLSQETVENLLFRLESGESHRVISEEAGVSRTDLTAIGKFYRRWQAWNLAEMTDSQQSPGNDQEKVAELMQKIQELEEKNDRILTEKVALSRELKLLSESTAGERKWLERFKPALDEQVRRLTEECATLTFRNKELEDQLSHKPAGEIIGVTDVQSIYGRGREAGIEEARREVEAQGTSWLTWMLIPLTGVAGIVAGALLVWVLS